MNVFLYVFIKGGLQCMCKYFHYIHTLFKFSSHHTIIVWSSWNIHTLYVVLSTRKVQSSKNNYYFYKKYIYLFIFANLHWIFIKNWKHWLNIWRRDQPRKRPKAPPNPLTRSSKSNANNSSSVFTRVFSADKKNEDDDKVFQSIFSSLI